MHAPIARAQFETTWTQEQLDSLTLCWADGLSSRKTAVKLNEQFGTAYTRNAVIGKARREGLPAHNGPIRGRPRGPSKRNHTAAPDITDLSIPFAQRKTIASLEYGDCKWPVGNPDEPDFFFCGAASLKTAPYCAGHAKRAYGYTREPNDGRSRFRL